MAIIPNDAKIQSKSKIMAICWKGEGKRSTSHTIIKKIKRSFKVIVLPAKEKRLMAKSGTAKKPKSQKTTSNNKISTNIKK